MTVERGRPLLSYPATGYRTASHPSRTRETHTPLTSAIAHLAALILGVPWLVKNTLPIVNRGGFKTYLFMVLLLGVPVAVAYWTFMSTYGPRKNTKVQLPGRDIEEYITIKDEELKALYHGKEKIPMQVFHDAYFDGKIDFNG